jgi:ribonuclease-3
MGWFRKLFQWFRRQPQSQPELKLEQSETPSAQRQSLLQDKLEVFQQLLGYKISNPDVFVQALLHRSFIHLMGKQGRSNERLEFLGDSILNLVVGRYLFQRFPEAEEGDLTKMRSRLVNRNALLAYAQGLRLHEFIFMSASAAQSIGKGGESIISDTYEAIVAAIFLDGGFEPAKKFVEQRLLIALKNESVVLDDVNYKSMLLEYSQARGLGSPRYSILKEQGPDHDRVFTVEVLLNEVTRGVGAGKNKKQAEQAAANEAIKHLKDFTVGGGVTMLGPSAGLDRE